MLLFLWSGSMSDDWFLLETVVRLVEGCSGID